MLMLDIGSGLGGASQAMKEHGWQVITVDIDSLFQPTVVADMRTWSWRGERPDLVWCSPPCTEFAKFAMPCWYLRESLPLPNMELVLACKRIIEECKPHYWVIENVRGAVEFFLPILGRPLLVCRPYFLWGHFPPLSINRWGWRRKTKDLSSTAKAKRAQIPASLSWALMVAVESQQTLGI